MDIVIKEMSVEYTKDIHQLSAQLGYSIGLKETEFQIKRIVKLKDHLALIAEKDNKIIGWIHAFIALRIETKPFIEIGGLVVDENFRNNNIGRKLIESVVKWSRKENIFTLRVRCNTKRIETHLFYKKLNFIETKEQKIFQLEL